MLVFGADATIVYGAVGEVIGAQARAIRSRGFIVEEGAARAVETVETTMRKVGRYMLVVLNW